MFKEKLKGFMIGIISSTLFAGTVAYSAGGSELLEVFYKVNDIKINMVSKMPKDADGKPFIYKGSTYVPLRYIAENLDQKVGWDSKTGTIFIGETNGPNEEFLGERVQPMNTQLTNSSWDKISLVLQGNKVQDNLANEYENYVSFLASMAVRQGESIYQEYPLSGKYSSFKAKVGVMKDEQNSPNIVTFIIEGDGKELYTHDFGPGDFPENISINVKGINKLTLRVALKEEKDFNAHSMIGVFNPTLTLK